MDSNKKFNQYIKKEVDESIENVINFFYKNIKPSKRFYIYPDIPWKKFAVARKRFVFLQKDEHILGFYDDTLFGSGKDGFAITTRGIYWKAIFAGAEFRSYEDLSKTDIVYNNINRFFLLGNDKIFMNMLDRTEISDITIFLKKTSYFFNGIEFSQHEDSQKSDSIVINEYKNKIYKDDNLEHIRRNTEKASRTLENIEKSYKKTEELLNNTLESENNRIDLNSAAKEELFILECFDNSNIEIFISERIRRNGFKTVEEIGDLLGLQPHELLHLNENCCVKTKNTHEQTNEVIKRKKTVRFGRRIVDY